MNRNEKKEKWVEREGSEDGGVGEARGEARGGG